MNTEVILVVAYTLFFSFVFWHWRSLLGNNGAWKKQWLVALFVLKVSIGIFYGVASPHFLNAPDSQHFYNLSKVVSASLPQDPQIFVRLVFGPGISHPIPPEILPYKKKIPVWKNTGSYTMVRLHAFMGLFSGQKYFVNIVFWNVLSTIGLVLLWRAVFRLIASNANRQFVQIFLCLNPALLFWASGAHKEGIALFSLGVVVFFTTQKPIYWASTAMRRILAGGLLVFAGVLLFQVRHYYFLMLLLSLGVYFLALFLAEKRKSVGKNFSIPWFFAGFYFCCSLGVIVLDKIANLGILRPLVGFRNEFITFTQGRSDFELPLIEPTWHALLPQLPIALLNVFCRPLPWDIIHLRSFLAFIEGLILFFAGAFFILKTNWQQQTQPLPQLFIYWGFTAMLIIGLVADNSGAIVRYRALPYSFLLLGLGLAYILGRREKDF